MKQWRHNLLAALAGALLPLAFAPLRLWPLALLCPAMLLFLWQKQTARSAFISGWLFGLGTFLVGTSWIFISIHRYGDMGIIFSAALTFGFALFLGFWTGLQGVLWKKLSSQSGIFNALALFPATVLLLTWLFSWVLSGFPWLLLGTSQVNAPLGGFLPVFGILGTSGICAFAAALCCLILTHKGPKKRLILLFTLILLLLLGMRLQSMHYSRPVQQPPLSVALVQGNIPQNMRWDPNAINHILWKYQHLSEPHWQPGSLIVWPENAIPIPPTDAPAYFQQLAQQAKKTDTSLILGTPVIHPPGYYNALLLLGPHRAHYYKRHLVPFGEYLPLAGLLRGAIQLFDLPMSNFIPGDTQQALLTVQGLKIAPFICYEIAYSTLVRAALPAANLLLNISNDAWFGDSFAAWQQLEIAQAQSVVSARPQIVATNNGLTALIDPHGRITARLPRAKTAILLGQVQGYMGMTPWVMWGEWPALLSMLFVFLFAIILRRIQR